MDWLNYHHLYYFWVVAREGSVARACAALDLAQPTVSGQVRALEKALNVPLFARRGRGLVLTEAGEQVFRYAADIFALGRELMGVAAGGLPGRPTRLRVGVADVLPKLVAHRLIRPALRLPAPVRVVCTEGKPERLAADLAAHQLDVVLSDAPPPPAVRARTHAHLLGGCGVAVVGTAKLAAAYRAGFPASLNGAPFLLPLPGSDLRGALDRWFAAAKIRPDIRGEFEDSGLLKAFGRAGEGLFAVPTAAERDVRRHYRAVRVGLVPGARQRFYAITAERRVSHPAVAAICAQAEQDSAGPDPG